MRSKTYIFRLKDAKDFDEYIKQFTATLRSAVEDGFYPHELQTQYIHYDIYYRAVAYYLNFVKPGEE